MLPSRIKNKETREFMTKLKLIPLLPHMLLAKKNAITWIVCGNVHQECLNRALQPYVRLVLQKAEQ